MRMGFFAMVTAVPLSSVTVTGYVPSSPGAVLAADPSVVEEEGAAVVVVVVPSPPQPNSSAVAASTAAASSMRSGRAWFEGCGRLSMMDSFRFDSGPDHEMVWRAMAQLPGRDCSLSNRGGAPAGGAERSSLSPRRAAPPLQWVSDFRQASLTLPRS
ncbi:MAG: hypothetical protein Kow00122_13380 [Thermoleophilia bacterium]